MYRYIFFFVFFGKSMEKGRRVRARNFHSFFSDMWADPELRMQAGAVDVDGFPPNAFKGQLKRLCLPYDDEANLSRLQV